MRYERLGALFGLFLISSILVSSNSISMVYAAPGQGILYGTDSFNTHIFSINPITGVPISANVISGGPLGANALALDPSGQMWLGTGSGIPELYMINPATGVAVFQCDLFAFGVFAIEDMDFHPTTGNLWASVNMPGPLNGGTDLIEMDTNCNVNSQNIFADVTGNPIGSVGAIAFDSTGLLHVATTGTNGEVYTSTLTGALTQIGAGNGFDQSAAPPLPQIDTLTGGLTGLQFDCTSDSVLYGGTGRGGNLGGGDLATVNVASGAGTIETTPRDDGQGNPITTTGLADVMINAPFDFGGRSLSALAFDSACAEGAVGGEIISIDTAALLIAGAQANYSIISLLAIAGAFGALFYSVKRKSEKQ